MGPVGLDTGSIMTVQEICHIEATFFVQVETSEMILVDCPE